MKVLSGLIFFWGFGWFWLRLEIIKFGFLILKWFWLVEIKINKIVTKMPRNMFNRWQETWPIRMNMFKCSYNFLENVDKNMELWTKTWHCGQKFRVYLWTFKWTQKCSYNFLEMWTKTWNYGQKYEIIDKNMKYTFWIYLNVHK